MNKSILAQAVLASLSVSPVLAGDGGVTLDYTYTSADQIPTGYEGLYSEVDGVFRLTAIRGLKTPDDVNALQNALVKERNDHKQTKERFRALGDRDVNEVLASLDRISELEAAAGGKLDDAAIDKLVEGRIATKLNPVQRELKEAQDRLLAQSQEIEQYKTAASKRKIHDMLGAAGRKLKVIDTAFDDMLLIGEHMLTVDDAGNVVTTQAAGMAGLSAEVWLTEQQRARPHWFPTSHGAGASGSKGGQTGANPFSADGWNLTEQGKLVKTDRALAEQLAKAAGTTIGGPRPTKK